METGTGYMCERCKQPIKNAMIVLLCDACLKTATEEAKREKGSCSK